MSKWISIYKELLKIIHWMNVPNPPKKTPNFSKLNKGDFLYVEEKSCEGACENYGYFYKIEGDFFVLDKFNNRIMEQTIKKSNITKIMRIDIEKKYVEEI